MQIEELETIYNDRIEKSNVLIGRLKKRDLLFIVIKLLLFSSGVFLFFKFFPGNLKLSFFFLTVFLASFIISALLHEQVLKKIKYYRTLIRINENEIKMLRGQFLAEIDNGEEFIDHEHYYTSDLDIFGERSLFHYINRTVTGFGRERLAQSLRKSCKIKEIKERQEAVKEMREKLDFRQNIQAHGLTTRGRTLHSGAGNKNRGIISRFTPGMAEARAEEPGENTLFNLFDREFFLLGKKTAIFFIHLIPLITIALFISLFFNLPLGVPLLAMVLQLVINMFLGKRVSRIYKLTSKNGKILKTYAGIIKEIEDESFNSVKLKFLQSNLFVTAPAGSEDKGARFVKRSDVHKAGVKDVKASLWIKRLSNLLEWFDLRSSGMMHFVLNNILLYDLHCVYRIEKWKKKAAHAVNRWFDVIGEVEVLSSFANLYFNNPGWSLPVIKQQDFFFKAAHTGHPLIPRAERVCNDITLDRAGSILIVTGPNMAGKSTFLRTLGVNGILALCGSPVCASHLEMSPFKLITSMQSADSLDKHLSLFYAELQRLKLILDNIAGKDKQENKDSMPVFFLIDEMLKGTNAVDRQKGSVALLNQLIEKYANGTVATHDLKLTRLEKFGERVQNYHFDGEIKDDKLIFDFKLRKGVCQSANALVLMKKVGIDI